MPPLRPGARPRLVARRGAGRLGGGGPDADRRSTASTELTPLPQGQPFSFDAQRPALAARGLSEAENELGGLLRQELDVVVAFPHRGEALRQQQLLRRVRGTSCSSRARAPAGLSSRSRRRAAGSSGASSASRCCPTRRSSGSGRRARRRSPGRALQSFSDLRTGDYVVHEDHGIAQLLGFETKEVAGVTRDYLLLAYRGDDRVYVPHEQIGKVSRYIGADSQGADALEARRQGVGQPEDACARASARDGRRAACSSTRSARRSPGIAYDVEHEWVERLESEFPYRETEDQRTAIEAVKEDLEAPHPMDRLVCGDVGFGKTEVALRAAFAVAVNGKQVLMLVPTTVLAQQHWNTFRERYRDFPVRVEMVSRFRKPAEVKQVLAEFAEGKVEVLIGTHRVLSRDVIPKELGLVIVDEEQRFGVAQKELLRQLRLEVDVLALSATPIPRTLHMSLAGLRDISVIETPPEGRRPIRTFVGEYDEELIKQALDREVAREAARRSTSTTASRRSRKPPRSCGSSARRCASSSRTARCAERELEDQMICVPRRRRRRARLDDDHRVGARHPAGEHADRRARRPARARASSTRSAGASAAAIVLAHAYLFYPDAHELTPGGARPARDARRPHRARRGLRDRDARPRDPRRRRPARRRAVRPRRRARLRALRRDAARGGRRALRAAAARRPAGSGRRARRRVRSGRVHRAPRRSRSTCTAASRSSETEDELHELRVATEDRYGPLPEPVENLFAIQEAKLKLAVLGADYLVFRGGRATVGPVVLGSGELRELREQVETAVYSTGNREVTLRGDEFKGALDLVDAMLAARQAA